MREYEKLFERLYQDLMWLLQVKNDFFSQELQTEILAFVNSYEKLARKIAVEIANYRKNGGK